MNIRTGTSLGLGLGVAVLLSGCQEQAPEGFARFVPASEVARKALTTTLEAWRRGDAPGMIETTSPKLLMVDARRVKGLGLESFEILGEFPAENGRGFVARLTFEGENSDEPPTARYCVIGIDPLYLYRQEDLEMFCHWTHPMDEPKAEKAP